MLGAWILLLCGHVALPGAAEFALLTLVIAVAFISFGMPARREAHIALRVARQGREARADLVPLDSLSRRLRGLEAELHALDDQFATEQGLTS